MPGMVRAAAERRPPNTRKPHPVIFVLARSNNSFANSIPAGKLMT
jgi:hypothetical protein